MHIEVQQHGVQIHISIDEKLFPKINTLELCEHAQKVLHGIEIFRRTTALIEPVSQVETNGQYL